MPIINIMLTRNTFNWFTIALNSTPLLLSIQYEDFNHLNILESLIRGV